MANVADDADDLARTWAANRLLLRRAGCHC